MKIDNSVYKVGDIVTILVATSSWFSNGGSQSLTTGVVTKITSSRIYVRREGINSDDSYEYRKTKRMKSENKYSMESYFLYSSEEEYLKVREMRKLTNLENHKEYVNKMLDKYSDEISIRDYQEIANVLKKYNKKS